ncbi:Uncharacterised protein [Algoriella xinjiangensis]|nr:Uncharacterised protein [Algoriella xinjiangensis]
MFKNLFNRNKKEDNNNIKPQTMTFEEIIDSDKPVLLDFLQLGVGLVK